MKISVPSLSRPETQAAHLLGTTRALLPALPHTTQYNHLYRPTQRRATLAERGQANGDTYCVSQDAVSTSEAVETKGSG